MYFLNKHFDPVKHNLLNYLSMLIINQSNTYQCIIIHLVNSFRIDAVPLAVYKAVIW